MSEQEVWHLLTVAGGIITVGIVAFFIYSVWRSWKNRWQCDIVHGKLI